MKEQLETRALLCEVAYVNGSEGVGCHGNIIPLVEISDRSSVDDDVDLLSQLLGPGALKPKTLMCHVPGQRGYLLLDQGLEGSSVFLPQNAEQLFPYNLLEHTLVGSRVVGRPHQQVEPLHARLNSQDLLHQQFSQEAGGAGDEDGPILETPCDLSSVHGCPPA